MAKGFPSTAQVERQGVNLCASIVNDMGHIWRKTNASDVGIDGQIELVDPDGRAALARFILVQSKARSTEFEAENDRTFRFRCDRNDLDYWMQASAPVLLVCSHPNQRKAWFKNLHIWFRDPARRAARVVEFDKVQDSFETQASGRLLVWGVSASTRIYSNLNRGQKR